MRRKNFLIFLGIMALTVVSAVFIYPKGFGEENMPWKLGLDLIGGTALVYEIDLKDADSADYDSIVGSLAKVIERRINPLGVLEPKVTTARKGDKYQLLVELAGVKELKDAAKFIGETPTLSFREIKDGEVVQTELSGRHIERASLDFDPNTNRPIVSFNLTPDGAILFESITERNIGSPLCIFVDNNFIYPDKPGSSCPTVQSKISGGSAVITGSDSIEDAKELVGRFKDGALAAPLTLINQRTVSGSIATDSLEKIVIAGLIGTVFIMLFMVIYYGQFGLFANLALVVYVLITLAVFKIISITMTLAGIAGFILSIGMAIDANILIFERTREELRKGLSKSAAIEEGFKRAWLSIRDSNVSTIMTSVILFYFTTSFIKGFALALLIGVLISMFSAIFVTRILLKLFVRK